MAGSLMLPGTRISCRVGALAHGLLERIEERLVGGRIMEGLAGRIEGRHAAHRQDEADRPVHLVQLLADPAAHGGILVGVVRISVTCGL